MGATYTRQSSYTDGDVINAADTNDEFDQLLAAFNSSSGHTHDGTTAEGGPITKLLGMAITIGNATSGTDIVVTFDGETNDGVLTWMEDEDYFKFSDDILMNSTEKLQFGDTASFIQQSSDGVLRIDGEATVDINASTAVTISNDLKLDSDAAVLGFGSDNDVTLTHVADTALLLNAAMVIQFRDSALSIGSSTDGQLDIAADAELEITSPIVDIDASTGLALDGANLNSAWTVNTTNKIQFRDTGLYINSSTDGQLDIDADTEVEITAPTVHIAASTAITMGSDAITFGEAGDTDIVLTFNSNTADGVLTWMEDEDYFKFSDDILMNSTEKLQFGDTASFIQQSSDGVLRIDGEATVDINASTAVTISNDLKLDSDSAVLSFGADDDTTLTHTDGTGITLNSTNKLTFGDAASFIQQSSDGTLRIDGEAIIDLNASTRVDVSGDIKVGGEVQTASIGYTDGDNAITIADGGGITAAAGITSTAASNTLGATSFNDANITNVGDVALDSISADDTDINIAVTDNSATALTVKQGSDAYIIIDTANSSESVSIGTGISGTAITIGHSTSETTVADNLTVSGNLTVDGNFDVTGTFDLSDSDFTNAGDIQLDSITGDSDTNTSITFSGSDVITVATGGSTSFTVDASQNILMNAAQRVQLRDTAIYLHSSADGQADLVADSVIQVTAPTVNIEASTAITLESDSITLGENGDTDVVVTFNANSADGVLTWMEDEDYFKFSDDVLMNSTEKLLFGDTGTYIHQSADGVLDLVSDTEIEINATTIDMNGALEVSGAITGASTVQGTTITATTAFVPDASDGAALGSASLEFSDLFLADGAVINFGDDQDVSLTHVADTGLLLSSTDQLQFGDSGTYIHQSADGVLDLVSDTEIEINATTIDVNGAMDLSGTLGVGGSTVTDSNILNIQGDGSAVNVGAVFNKTNGTAQIWATQVRNSDNAFLVHNYTASSTPLVISTAGNVGINTASPTSYANSQATLVIEDDTNPAIAISDTGQSKDYFITANGSALNFNYADGGGSGSASNVTSLLSLDNGSDGVIFNEGGADRDFRIEGDGESSLFFVDASKDRIGIGTQGLSSGASGSSDNHGILMVRDNTYPVASFQRNAVSATAGSYTALVLNVETTGTPASNLGAGMRHLVDSEIVAEATGFNGGEYQIRTCAAGGSLAERMALSTSEAVFNEDSADVDFRIESNNASNMIFVDGGNDHVCINTSTDANGILNVKSTDNVDTLVLFSTDGDANIGPILRLDRRSSGPADDDIMGAINWTGINDNSEDVMFGQIYLSAPDVSDGSEDGQLHIDTMVAGTSRSRIKLMPSETVINENSIDLDFRVESDGNANMLFVDAGNDRVGIGTGSPTARLHLDGNAGASDNSSSMLFSVGGTAESYVGVANGTGNIITGSASGDSVFRNDGGKILFSTDSGSSAAITISSSGATTFAASTVHARTATYTANWSTSISHASSSDYGTLHFIGDLATGGLKVFTNTTHQALTIEADGKTTTKTYSNDSTLVVENTNASQPYGAFISFSGAAPDNNAQDFLSCSDTSGGKLIIYSDGDVVNHDNSYGAISDERIKQDIVDANSQWDDIKAVKVRNYKKKDDVEQYGDKAWSQIGVIAQELEAVSPKLVKEASPSASDIRHSAEFGTLYTKDDAETQDAVLYTSDDEDVKSGEKEVGDIKTPSTAQIGDIKEIKENVKKVSYSVLYMKAIKALQEAMTRIETLEAKVTALEGG